MITEGMLKLADEKTRLSQVWARIAIAEWQTALDTVWKYAATADVRLNLPPHLDTVACRTAAQEVDNANHLTSLELGRRAGTHRTDVIRTAVSQLERTVAQRKAAELSVELERAAAERALLDEVVAVHRRWSVADPGCLVISLCGLGLAWAGWQMGGFPNQVLLLLTCSVGAPLYFLVLPLTVRRRADMNAQARIAEVNADFAQRMKPLTRLREAAESALASTYALVS